MDKIKKLLISKEVFQTMFAINTDKLNIICVNIYDPDFYLSKNF